MKTQLFVILLMMTFLTGCNNKEKSNMKKSKAEEVEINGAVGKIEAELQIPELKTDEKCPMVILMHGFMSSKDDALIRDIADQLQDVGIASIRFDFNGHGSSEGDFVNMTVPLEVQDALCVFNYVKTLDFVSGISLLGHSQGGVVASLVAGELRDSVKSLVLLAPAAVLVDDAKKGDIMGTKFDPLNVPEYIDVFNNHLGRDYILSAQQLNIYKKAENYTGPVCLIHGKADDLVPFSYSEKYDEVYQNSILNLLEDETHMFNRKRHETVDLVVDFMKEITY